MKYLFKFENKRISLFVALLVTFAVSKVSFADCHYETRQDNGKIWVFHSASVAQFGYTSMADNAMEAWNNVSFNVKINRTTETSGDQFDRVYVAGFHQDPLIAGATAPYGRFQNGTIFATTWDARWYYVTIVAYNSTMVGLGFDQAEIQSTICHEFGHALKLAHPGKGTQRDNIPIPAGKASVMSPGQHNYLVQAYDESGLKAKWGD